LLLAIYIVSCYYIVACNVRTHNTQESKMKVYNVELTIERLREVHQEALDSTELKDGKVHWKTEDEDVSGVTWLNPEDDTIVVDFDWDYAPQQVFDNYFEFVKFVTGRW